MTISYTVYDWPSVKPSRQLFYAGGAAIDGGFTSGGARMMFPEPGGRGVLNLEFDYQQNHDPDPLVSWLCTMIGNGNIFRIPILQSPQLVSLNDLGLSGTAGAGVPWNNEQPWDNSQNWADEVFAVSSENVLEGSLYVHVEFGVLPLVLRHGHLIGHDDVTYLVEDIEYNGTVATIKVNPPLRNDIPQGDMITFRPKMLAVAKDAQSFRGIYQINDLIKLGSAEFIEAII